MANQKNHLEHLREIRVQKPRPPQSIAHVLGKQAFAATFRKKSRLDRVREAWLTVCDSFMAEHSEVKSFRAGELSVICTSQAMASELTTHRHAEMLEKVNDFLDGRDQVARIIFRAGRR